MIERRQYDAELTLKVPTPNDGSGRRLDVDAAPTSGSLLKHTGHPLTQVRDSTSDP